MSWRDKTTATAIAELKAILENIWQPEALNDHPWTRMRIVAGSTPSDAGGSNGGAGAALLKAVSGVFEQMRPSVPPRRGIRLDTRWGEFGLLAARYFAPLKFGTPFPASLRDAWGRIDDSILLYVFGRVDGSIPDDEKARYRLVGAEPDVAPMSTLSDWHKKGLQHLWEHVQIREDQVERRALGESMDRASARGRPSPDSSSRRRLARVLGVLVLVSLALLGVKTYRIYGQAVQVRQDVQRLQADLHGDSLSEAFLESDDVLQDLNAHLGRLGAELKPGLWLTPALRWIPVYGDDLAQAGDLLDLAIHLSASAKYAQSALAPLVPTYDDSPRPPVAELIALLSDAEPQLQLSLEELRLAQQARDRIDPALLMPQLRSLITQQIDPGMALMADALPLAAAAPSLMGAGDAGPRTYLLLAQNEDELRPTGGFITAVGKVVLDRGKVVDLTFQNSGDLDNWSMPYPVAPWQLNQYMNSRVLILRDSNWFPDFPTATLYVRQLYAYVHQDSVDGIVAFDQHFLLLILRAVGPLRLDGVEDQITADNVTEYMRSSKSLPSTQSLPAGWTSIRKEFIAELAQAVMHRVMDAKPSNLRALASAVLQALDERHLLLQIDDPQLGPVLEEHGWNGALRSDLGDFLMVADTNVGFNKTNAVVGTSLVYDVDLRNLAETASELTIQHDNRATPGVPCVQWNSGQITGEEGYPVNRCYWDYIRVYAPQGTQLISGTPQSIPPEWMILNRTVPPVVDILEEPWPGLQGFGTLIVVPGGETVDTELQFALPASRVLTLNSDGTYTYRLEVRKQPGTISVPLTVSIDLPNGAVVQSPAPRWVVQGSTVLIETDLRVDRHFEINFRLP